MGTLLLLVPTILYGIQRKKIGLNIKLNSILYTEQKTLNLQKYLSWLQFFSALVLEKEEIINIHFVEEVLWLRGYQFKKKKIRNMRDISTTLLDQYFGHTGNRLFCLFERRLTLLRFFFFNFKAFGHSISDLLKNIMNYVP